jgi:hypothetical protein
VRNAPKLFALLLLASAVQGCAAVRFVRLALGQKILTIDPHQVVFTGVRADGFHFDVGLQLRNLTRGEARLTGVRLEALVGETAVFSTHSDQHLLIPPHGSVSLQMPAVLSPAVGIRGAATGQRTLTFAGSVEVDLGLLGRKEIGFRSEKKLLPRASPAVELAGLSLAESRLDELVLNLKLRLRAPEGEQFSTARLTGTAYVNGRRAGAIEADREAGSDVPLEVRLSLPTISAAAIAARIVRERTCDLKAELLFEAETETLTYRVPYVLKRRDLRLGRAASEPSG